MLEIGICEDMSMQNSGHFVITDLEVFANTLRGRWSKMVQKSSEDSRMDLRWTEGTHSYPRRLQSYVHLSSERVAELHAFEGFPSAGSCKNGVNYRTILRTFLFVNPSFWSINSNRTLGFGLTLLERERFSSKLELSLRRKRPVNWSFGIRGLRKAVVILRQN